jgi:hypothetical protein
VRPEIKFDPQPNETNVFEKFFWYRNNLITLVSLMGMRICICSYGNWKLLMLIWEFEYAYGVLLVKRLLTPKIS